MVDFKAYCVELKQAKAIKKTERASKPPQTAATTFREGKKRLYNTLRTISSPQGLRHGKQGRPVSLHTSALVDRAMMGATVSACPPEPLISTKLPRRIGVMDPQILMSSPKGSEALTSPTGTRPRVVPPPILNNQRSITDNKKATMTSPIMKKQVTKALLQKKM